ncbi:MAG: hypothetical protein AAGU05_03780, partial [Anaerolineaceae bacterium]
EMTDADVQAFLDLCAQNDIDVYVDGGWGVDALLGYQSRAHSDLDVAIPQKDSALVRALLEELGFIEVPRNDSWECNYVMGDSRGCLIDIHTFTFDENGKLVSGVEYPFASLRGSGVIAGRPVKCITPEWMVKFHTGYPLDENDWHDVQHLCDKFQLPIPDEYQSFFRDSYRQ